jgi:hypothetical protein
MKLIASLIALLMLPVPALADITNCTDIYVGSMIVNKVDGLKTVVFLNSPLNSSGSYAVFINGWEPEAKKEAMTILTAAKIAQHKVYIQTEAEDGCSINTPGQVLKLVSLRNNK